MFIASTLLRVPLALALFLTPGYAHAQDVGASRVHAAAGGGVLTSSAYFTGPGDLEVSNGDAFVVALQTSVAVHRAFAVVVAAAHARPEGRLSGVPLIGSVTLSGVRLWFADAALRWQAPHAAASRGPAFFAQAGAGIVHYSIATSLLGTAVDEHASNFAIGLGAGLTLPVARRLDLEVMAKDYIASFKSVRDLAEFGVEGQRAHTLLLLAGVRLGL